MNSLAARLPFGDRFAALSRRERILIGFAAGALLLFLFYMLMPRAEDPGVELASAPAPAATIPAPVVQEEPPAPAPAAAAPAEDLLLKGVLGGGAILAMPGGQQRLVRIGREFLPGLTLKQIGIDHVVIGRAEGDLRLEMGKAGGGPVGPAAQSASASSAPGGPAAINHARETMAYRLGMQPVRTNGRTKGYVIKGSDLPHLSRAGLRPGDILVSVNGSALDEERLMDLSWEIANASSTEFEFVRSGRPMKAKLK